jgi:Lon protease-like protein
MPSNVNNSTDYATRSDLRDLADRTDQRFDALDKKIDDRFDDVIGLLQTFMVQVSDEFEKVHAEQRAMRRDIDRIMSHLDSIEKRLEISEDERLVMGHQLKRLQVWTEHLADKIGVDLTKIKA